MKAAACADNNRGTATLGHFGGCFIVRIAPLLENAVTAERINDADTVPHCRFRRICFIVCSDQTALVQRFALRYIPVLPLSRRKKGGLRMNRYDLLLATIAAVLIAGCASVAPQTAEAQRDKTVVTGSRLPAREGAASADVKAISNQDGIDDMMRRSNVYIPPKGGPL